jgi:hypothetical protein
MATFRVFYERTEIGYADIEADSAEEAEKLAEENYSDQDWRYADGSLDTNILTGETEEL